MSVKQISFRKKIALELHKKYRRNASKLHHLNYIFWECTLKCNLNCVHCGSDCKQNASEKDMAISDFLRAIDQLEDSVNPNRTMIVLTGGEPLLRKDIEEVGLSLYKRGFPWGTVTNGMLLTVDRVQSLLNAGMRAITVSLDGLENSHNWLRSNRQSFQRATKGIKLLAQVTDFRFDVVTCVNQNNFTELEELKEFLISVGVKEWRIFTIFPIGRAQENEQLQLPPKQFKELFEFIVKTRKEGRIKLSYGCEGFLGNYEGEVRDNFFMCRAGINVASILVDGSISACPNLRSNFTQGNIYKDNFKDVWENRYEIYRDKSWTKTGICAECDFFENCEGNGMHLHGGKNNELLFCHLKRIEEAENLE